MDADNLTVHNHNVDQPAHVNANDAIPRPQPSPSLHLNLPGSHANESSEAGSRLAGTSHHPAASFSGNAFQQELQEKKAERDKRMQEKKIVEAKAVAHGLEQAGAVGHLLSDPAAPDDGVLARAQVALRQQFLDRKLELVDKIFEQGKFLKRATKQREDAGVQLYGMQKILASLHVTLHKSNDAFSQAQVGHTKAENRVTHMQKVYTGRRAEMEALTQKMDRSQLELDKLGATLQQIEAYNDQLKSEIAISRRATYAGEEHVVRAEKIKKQQDILITQLQQRLKQSTNKLALVKAQLSAQQRETKVAYEALTEAGVEMESINSEKKQVTLQWKSSLVVLARCDEAYQALLDSIGQQKEQEKAVEAEKEAFCKAITVEKQKIELHNATLLKVELQLKILLKQIKRVVDKRLAIESQYGKYQISLLEIDANIATVKQQISVTEVAIKVTEKALEKQYSGFAAIEAQMLKSLGEQIILEKSSQATVQGTLDLRQRVRAEDMVATEIQYELARIRVDILTVQKYNDTVNEALVAIDEDVQFKFSLISKMQTEIRRRHAEVEMKTKEIDRLNKQYEKLTANMVDKDTTPWEHIIHKLGNEINEKVKASSELQKQWLIIQTALVSVTTEDNHLTEDHQQKEVEKTVLEQRNRRLNTQFNLLQKNVKDLDSGVRFKHHVITRLNDLIARNQELQTELATENDHLELNNFLDLKELDNDMIKMEVHMGECCTEKSEVLGHVSELERHIQLWKCKIAYEKETQECLDPDAGQAVLGRMRKEFERLKLRLDDLQCQREKLICGLESRVLNRKAIATKVKAIHQKRLLDGTTNSGEAALVKACNDLKKAIKEGGKTSVGLDNQLEVLEKTREDYVKRTEDTNIDLSVMIKELEQLRGKLREANLVRSAELMATSAKQRLVKHYDNVLKGKWKVEVKSSGELAEAQRKLDVLLRLVLALVHELPEFQVKLENTVVQIELASGVRS